MKQIFKSTFLVALPILSVSVVVEGQSKKPNIIYILADDLGYGDLGCYGQKHIETPNLDKMAAQGMKFTQHYSGSAVSAPTRSSLMTGQHTGHSPIRDNIKIFDQPNQKGRGQKPMPAATITVAEILKEVGYATGVFGKWGLGYPGGEGDPNMQGFDEFYGYNCQTLAHRFYPEYLWHNQEKVYLGNKDVETGIQTPKVYSGDSIHKYVLKFIDDNKEKSFFVYYANLIPHVELIMPDGPLVEKYRNREGFKNEKPHKKGPAYGVEKFNEGGYCPQIEPRATYAGMISLLDQQVGEIMEKLEEYGIADNTIIMFASDNGPTNTGGVDMDFFNSAGPLKGKKGQVYEGGIRVPFIVRWDGNIKAGSESNHISAVWDMFPTFAEIIGSTTEYNHIDGVSLLPTLLGKEQIPHDHLFWKYKGKYAVRQGDFKLIKSSATKVELYNLATDLSEIKDLATDPKYADKIEELKAIMDTEYSEEQVFNTVQ